MLRGSHNRARDRPHVPRHQHLHFNPSNFILLVMNNPDMEATMHFPRQCDSRSTIKSHLEGSAHEDVASRIESSRLAQPVPLKRFNISSAR